MESTSTSATAKPSNETIRLVIGILGSLAVAMFIGILASQWLGLGIPMGLGVGMLMIMPVSAYILTALLSIVYQQIAFGKIEVFTVLLQNLAVLVANLLITFILWFESVPIFKYMFGEYQPRNPITGDQLVPGSADYTTAMANQNHYKLSFFSGVVKAVLPVYFDDSMRDGSVYAYWSFWGTLLPWFAVLYMITPSS